MLSAKGGGGGGGGNTIPVFKGFCLSRPGIEPTTFRSRGGRSNHKATVTTRSIKLKIIFVAFVEDNGTISSIRYFENHVSYFVQNRRK